MNYSPQSATMTTPVPRYARTYREDELQLICDHALSGESICFVGIAGTGKSNITDLLRYDRYGYKQSYLGDKVTDVYFPRVDATTWNGKPEELWGLMLDELIEATESLPQPPASSHKVLTMSRKKEERELLASLRARVKWVCQDLGYYLMFMFDDIDEAVATGSADMLNKLFNLRSSDNKGKLSFLFFVKGLPHILRREQSLDEKFKFNENISSITYALKLYNENDARQMLEHLNNRGPQFLPSRELAPIQQLCGGHAGLLRTVYNIWINDRPSAINVATFYQNYPDAVRECRRIYSYLHPHEQEVAVRVACNQHTPEDGDVIDLLCRRGLLTSTNPLTWFSGLMAIFLREERE